MRPLSPGLVPTQINYKPQETLPPYVSSSSSSARSVSSEIDDTGENRHGPDVLIQLSVKKRPKKRRTRPSQDDVVLISYLNPNRPDIAREYGQWALSSASQSEAEEDCDHDSSTKKNRSESA